MSTQLKECCGCSLGLLVALPAAPDQAEDCEWQVVVVGSCAAAENDKVDSELKSHGLPTPNWDVSVESVLQHYPAGTSVGGIWVKVQDQEPEPILQLLVKKTKLMVSISFFIMYSHNVSFF